jgi:hypothetical protein
MTDALLATALVALLSIAPAAPASADAGPAPAPASSDSPLEEIAHVHATTAFCKAALEHATLGVQIAVGNDKLIAGTVQTLRVADPDYSDMDRHRVVAELGRQFVELKAAAVEGNRTMAELKALAKDAPTPEQRDALISFQEALDGALMRQKRLGDVIARATVILDNLPRVDEFQQIVNYDDAMLRDNYRNNQDPEGPTAHLQLTLGEIARQDADTIEYRATPIERDEDTAADRIDAAFNGC